MIKVAKNYSKEYINHERTVPVLSNEIVKLIQNVSRGNWNNNWIDTAYKQYFDKTVKFDDVHNVFKFEFLRQITKNPYNKLTGLENFNQVDICLGCTEYIDNLYQMFGQNNIQILEKEYRYHERIYKHAKIISNVRQLEPNSNLIISLPNVDYGDIHPQMNEILDICAEKQIAIHIDAAWLSASRGIVFNFNHPSIKTLGISMSKGFGLGWNRIGLRLSKIPTNDSIKIKNDFVMIPAVNISIGNYFLENLNIDHLWQTHYGRYHKICKDFNLQPTKCIMTATDKNYGIVGIGSLIRFLELHELKS